MDNQEECTCGDHTHVKIKNKKSILEKIKSKLCRKGSNTPTPAESQHVKTSSEEDEISFSRTSSGIGTLSTKSKLFQEDDSQSIRDDSIVSINSQGNDFTKDSVIPVIQRHNFGVFSSKQANTSSSSGNDIHRRNTYDKYANFDKISIAENDDKDFEYFATKDDTDHENELKVRDWHVMLENTEQHHEHQVDFDDDGAKQRKNGKKKRRQQGYHHPEQIATSVVQRERKRKNKITPDPEECVQSERDKGKIMMSTSGKNMETGQELQIPEDLSDCSSKDETKPAKRTLKKTFTSLLSKIQLGRFSTDASSVTDTDSNCESSRKPGKKSFMYFASSAGRGFIISDDEEITGVISVKNKKQKKSRQSSFREKISDTFHDTLRKKRRSRPKKPDPIDFLYVNKPDFSSNESVHVTVPVLANGSTKPTYKSEVAHFING